MNPEIIGVDIKTINIRVPLSEMLVTFSHLMTEIEMYEKGTFMFTLGGYGPIKGELIHNTDDGKEVIASIKEISLGGKHAPSTLSHVWGLAQKHKGRLDLYIFYSDNHIERHFISKTDCYVSTIETRVSDYIAGVINSGDKIEWDYAHYLLEKIGNLVKYGCSIDNFGDREELKELLSNYDQSIKELSKSRKAVTSFLVKGEK